MPATTSPASPRQITYINDLRRERGIEPLSDGQAHALTGGRHGTASAHIEELLAMPRTTIPGTSIPARASNADFPEELPVPQERNRVGRQIQGGGCVATVTLPNGEHVTIEVKVRARRPYGRRTRWQRVALIDEGAQLFIEVRGQRVGRVEAGLAMRWYTGNGAVKDAVRALFGYAAGSDQTGTYHAYRVQTEDRCGRCGRGLTDPESIDRGIGPECYGRSTRSRHARVTDADRREARHAATAAHPANAATPERLTQIADNFAQASTARVRSDVEQARDTIETALKFAVEDEQITETAMRSALATFDRMARSAS